MRSLLSFRTRFWVVFLVVVGAGIGVFYFVSYQLDRWTNEIVSTNTELTQTTVHNISLASGRTLDSLGRIGFFGKHTLTKEESHALDHVLASLVSPQAAAITGMEGGFYLANVDELLGYSWPTSPPPPPAYGPAPRSYPIIRDQLIRTVQQASPHVEYHQFDFATFPLATEPLFIDGKTVGAVWARIHVERELPSNLIARWLNYAIIASLLVLIIVFVMTLRMRSRVAEIRHGLDRLQSDPSFRLPEQRGVFGAISSSINAMVDARVREQSQREQLERELHQQDKMATLGKLVAGVAHEVKTPLAIIKTRIQLWQQDLRTLGPRAEVGGILSEDAIQLVLKEINRLSGLLKRLLVFSKPVGSTRRNVDLVKFLDQIATFVRPDAEGRGITLTIIAPKGLPHLHVDPQALEQVLLNMCSNAMDAMTGGGSLTIECTVNEQRDGVCIHIRDTGHGIPREIRDKLFDPFFTTKEHGAGLGLYITQEIVRAHGGSILFEDRPGGGTECRIVLPVQINDQRNP